MWGFGPRFPGFGPPVFMPQPALAFQWLGLHMLALLVAYVAWAVLHYSCWTTLPERYRRTTPEHAAGLLFIPVFNFYWVFVSLGRLAAGFDAWSADHPDRTTKPAGGLAIAKASSFVAYWTMPGCPDSGRWSPSWTRCCSRSTTARWCSTRTR